MFRDTISLRSVSQQLAPGGIGYIYVTAFRENTGEQLFEALEALQQVDALALILDFRSNAGGSENAALAVLGQFLGPGSSFISKENAQGIREELRVPEDLETVGLGDMPTVVIVDEGTQSEAEAVAAVLRESGRAVLLGTKTSGKGGSYQFLELNNGSALYLPTSKWFTPEGKPLGGNGVEPDIAVALQPDQRGIGGESQFNRAYEYLDDLLPPFR